MTSEQRIETVWENDIPTFPFDHARIWKVAASAGCGKSFENARAIIDLVQKRGVEPEKIMYIIFNKKPADEFIGELRQMGVENVPWMGTFSSTCRKLMGVKSNNILTGKKLKDWGAQHGIYFSEEGEDETEWDKVLASLQLKILNEDDSLDPHERKLLTLLQHEEKSTGKFTFFRFAQATINLGLVPQGVEYVFIDEAQDNSKLEYKYFELLKNKEEIKGIMLVGDDKQAINRFKGGRWDLFMDFKADRYVCLGKTYRCAVNILYFANKIAEVIKDRSPLTHESNKKEPGEVLYRQYIDDAIPDLIGDIKNKKSVFVLYRSGKHNRNNALAALSSYGIPVESVVTDRILRVFHAMRALAKKEIITLDDLAPILPSQEPSAGEMKRTAYWKRLVLTKFQKGDYSLEKEDEVHKRIEYEKISFGIDRVDLSDFGFSPKFMEDVQNTLHNIIPKGVWTGVSDDHIRQIEQNIKTYGINMGYVTVSTIHSIKGGEADTTVLLKNITKATETTERNEPDEERRVWYVGATRAKTKLIITKLFERHGRVTNII